MNLTANGTPTEADILSRLELEKSRHVIHVKQNMDAQRQQEFGINQYVWHSSNEACETCAPLDGQIFNYNDGNSPGEIHPNCQCSAEPVPDGDGKPAEYPLSDKILEIAILLASLFPYGRAAKIGTKVVRGLGKIGDKIINGTGGNKPPPKPPEKPPTEKPVTNNPEHSKSAEKIANGHSYDKHVEKNGEFPEVKTREDLKKHIEDVMNNPTKIKELERGRAGYWDKETGSVVIENPNSPDGGTIFRPTDSENYFDKILK